MEYLWFPNGAHALIRPRERMELMTSAADWINFWLNEKTPADQGRAARWVPLRKMQAKVLEEISE